MALSLATKVMNVLYTKQLRRPRLADSCFEADAVLVGHFIAEPSNSVDVNGSGCTGDPPSRGGQQVRDSTRENSLRRDRQRVIPLVSHCLWKRSQNDDDSSERHRTYHSDSFGRMY